MNEDPIVAEIRRYRAEHAEHYGHDLGRICEALKVVELDSPGTVVVRRPRLLSKVRPAAATPHLTQPQAPNQTQ
ncbi:hypothetical protein [Allochromatium palmeri]|uniref:Uncharacterized protein n=1 Tax=Allochromatium palmeri TaxID=231048 RepID=A0A6N8EB07_9GAMM|nr:hypothetical protein [Allochromatium palmeri]MTW20059.1 hypothetical protein [Allochromatium palmeri]